MYNNIINEINPNFTVIRSKMGVVGTNLNNIFNLSKTYLSSIFPGMGISFTDKVNEQVQFNSELNKDESNSNNILVLIIEKLNMWNKDVTHQISVINEVKPFIQFGCLLAVFLIFSLIYYFMIKHNIKTISDFVSSISRHPDYKNNKYLIRISEYLIYSTPIFHLHVVMRLSTYYGMFFKLLKLRTVDYTLIEVSYKMILFFISVGLIMGVISLFTHKIRDNK